MSLERFYLPDVQFLAGAMVQLVGTEAHHAARVMRKKVGDQITLFDGCGQESEATISAIARGSIDLVVEAVVAGRRMPAVDVQLAVALPRAGEASDLVRRAVEQGVGSIQPIICRRSVQRSDRSDTSKLQEKLENAALAACKQSGRNQMPEILAPKALADLIVEKGRIGVFGAMDGMAQSPRSFERQHQGLPPKILVVVGPEGGLSAAEEAELKNRGFSPLSMGPLVLRIETAVVSFLAWLTSATSDDLSSS